MRQLIRETLIDTYRNFRQNTLAAVPGQDEKLSHLPRMDLTKILRELQIEKEELDQAIASLEDLLKTSTAKRRGRTFMGIDERRQVSERMKGYWASRREVLGKKLRS